MYFIDSKELTLSFAAGDESALVAYFHEFYASLCMYANSFTHNLEASKEIASEAFVKTWRYREQFREIGSIRAYLYTVVRGDASSWHKNSQRMLTTAFGMETVTDEPDHFEKLVKAETIRHLYHEIEKLPPQCRKIFKMMYKEGKKSLEIAKLLNIAKSTVKAQKARGISLLKKRRLDS